MNLRATILLCALFSLVMAMPASAGSATWKSSPATGDWNTATNWTPQTVPNGPSDVATFATSNKTGVSFSAQTEVNEITFNPGASAFTITLPANTSGFGLNISGIGITNDSGTTQKMVVKGSFPSGGAIEFFNSATAGTSTSYTVTHGGLINFRDSSTAGTGTFNVNSQDQYGANLVFYNASSAGNATFILNGDPLTGQTAKTQFNDSSTAQNGNFTLNAPALLTFGGTAGNATFTLNTNANGNFSEVDFFTGSAGNATFTINGATVPGSGGSFVQFSPGTSAGAATFIAKPGSNGGYGGQLSFTHFTAGGTSRMELFGNGTGDFTDGSLFIGGGAGGLTVGSIEGSGSVFLAGHGLTVGSNGLSTTFSGVIVDCPTSEPSCGSGGSLTKIGKGKLTITSANTYTGSTAITSGKLLVNNTSGSGTGTGPVLVNGGQLGGNGTIAGAVTVGNGKGRAAFLTPGAVFTVPGKLTIQGALEFNSDATYKIQINSTAGTADKVLASGITINTGAQFLLEDLGSGTLPPGTAFTVINNTSASPIAGTFINLPDKSTFTAGANTFKSNYEGGDGNDLTLTVQ